MPQIIKKVFSLSTLALITALTLSGIAAWYSVVGLTAIFAAAVIPIIIMGGALEFAKVVTTVWLHRYWDKCKWAMKTYLTGAVIVLALVTSMGIFGFLSKAHMDQGVPTGDIAAQIQLIDEKINTVKENIKVQRDNIAQSRSALTQMDNQVNARLDRGTSESSAERAVQIRRQQASERNNINKDITTAQKEIEKLNKEIADLNAEKAPISAKFRKVEAEVGPIKYIAALIYGDNPDQALLERAVRWVIILLIFVFDPLALMLVIAAISSYKWEFEVKEEEPVFAAPAATSYVPLDPTEREIGLTPFVEPIEEKPQILPRVFGKTVENHKANIPPALGMGKTVEVTDEPETKKAAVKKSLAFAQKALQNLQSEVSQLKNKLKQKFQKSNQVVESQEQSSSQLSQKFSWNQLTNWNNSPVLKLFNNLKNKLQK
jgi:hypothetical protein